MLTTKGIKKFCYAAVGIFLWSEDDIVVEKRGPYYFVSFKQPRAPGHLLKEAWEKEITGTKYDTDKIQININRI